MSLVVSCAAFWLLVLATFAPASRRALLRARGRREWVLDVSGLLIQGLVIPLAAGWALVPLWRALAPQLEGQVSVPAWLSFAACFVGVDYLFYWNHRLLHGTRLWPLHRVHHTLVVLDVLGTSRNTVWTSFLIVYVWATSVATFVLADATPYVAAVTLTAVLDLWRHSPLDPPEGLARVLRGWLVLPRDHAWHHAGDGAHGNYGANLMVWDRLHGTYRGGADAPERLGVAPAGTLTDEACAALDLAVTLRARMLALFPALMVVTASMMLVVAARAPSLVHGAAALGGAVVWIYLVPVAVYRLHDKLWPLRTGGSYLVGGEYSAWWGGHQIQLLYYAFPWLEAALRLVPGLYSAWLRLWGSKIGKHVYWTPAVEIGDRGLMEIGDGVIFGHRVAAYCHVIKPRRTNLLLLVRRVVVGSGAFVGAGVVLAPGAVIAPGAFVEAGTHVYPGEHVEASA